MNSLFNSTLGLCISILCVFSATAFAAASGEKPFGERSLMSNSSIAERIQKTGEVCLKGEDCAGKTMSAPAEGEDVQQLATGPRSGDAVYNSYCLGCHMSGAAGAPKVGDAAAWQARLDAKGDEGLWKSGWMGLGVMPPKGMCMDCSEDEFASAVKHMLAETL